MPICELWGSPDCCEAVESKNDTFFLHARKSWVWWLDRLKKSFFFPFHFLKFGENSKIAKMADLDIFTVIYRLSKPLRFEGPPMWGSFRPTKRKFVVQNFSRSLLSQILFCPRHNFQNFSSLFPQNAISESTLYALCGTKKMILFRQVFNTTGVCVYYGLFVTIINVKEKWVNLKKKETTRGRETTAYAQINH